MGHRLAFTLAVFVSVSLASVCPPAAEAAGGESCSTQVKDIPIDTLKASANVWTNLKNKPGSLNYETNAIFKKAKAQASALKMPDNVCHTGCALEPKAIFLFRSTPNKTLSNYGDAAHCGKLLSETKVKPHKYQHTKIHNVGELNDWIGALSQGKGASGKDLYAKCDKSCSPQFEYVISRNDVPGDVYTVNASILCGPARDKDDNQYKLEAFFRWKCKS